MVFALRSFVVTVLILASHLLCYSAEVNIRIIVTNDMHATVFSHDFMRNETHNGSLARVKTFVDQERARIGQHTVLLDNGDLLQGQPSGYFANYLAEDDTHLFARMLNLMRFDAATVGNHDIETGPEVYDRIYREFNFPWLGANAVDATSGQPYFQPYTMLEHDGVRTAVLGLIPPGIGNWLPQKLWKGLDFIDLLEAASYWVEFIKKNEQPDAIVGLFHTGSGPLGERDEYQYKTDNAGRYIARYVPGFDVIFLAHDHQQLQEKITNVNGKQVLLLSGQPFGLAVAVADLKFEGGMTERLRLKQVQGSIVKMVDFPPCEDFETIFRPDFESVSAYVNQKIGTLSKDMRSRDSYFGNAAFTDFVHHVQLSLTGADISFAAPLSFDVTIPAGEISIRDMFNLYRYENYLYTMGLSGREIKDFIEYSYGLWVSTMSSPDDHMLLFTKNDDGHIVLNEQRKARLSNPFYNFDSADGLIYEVDLTKEAGERVKIISMKNGDAFDLEKNYKVALNSYRGSGGGGHLTKGAGIPHETLHRRITYVSKHDLRSHMADYIKLIGVIIPKASSNWKFVPADWHKKASKKDYQLLFGKPE
jgi:2',3'-cyclic-nucleotide 2'-phosphodiesterase / 3'-nucleotidase